MAGKLRYVPHPDKPHLPKSVALARLAARSRIDEAGCRVWTGAVNVAANKPKSGHIIARSPTAKVRLLAHRLAWWCRHGVYPEGEYCLRHVCGNRLCIDPDHMKLATFQDFRHMTDAQVKEARELYWLPHMKLTRRQRSMKSPSPEQLAAWALSMTLDSVERVMAGNKVLPKSWQGAARNEDHVRAAVAAHQKAAALRREAKESVWTMPALAMRYKMHLSNISLMLNGETYAGIAMPDEARLRLQKIGQEKYAEEIRPEDPCILPDGSFDYSRPSQRATVRKSILGRRPAMQKMAGALDNVF